MTDPRIGVKPRFCPGCATLLDAATFPSGEAIRPKNGDRTICAQCMTILIFDADGVIRRPRDGELADMDNEDRLQLASAMVQLGLMNLKRFS